MPQTPPTVHRDLAYVTGGHVRQKLDLYLPKAEPPVPLIVWIHGGAFRVGDEHERGGRLEGRGTAVGRVAAEQLPQPGVPEALPQRAPEGREGARGEQPRNAPQPEGQGQADHAAV